MGIHVVIVPVVTRDATEHEPGSTVNVPDFGGARVVRWGQASGKWRLSDGVQAAWVECDDAALTKILAVRGASHVGKASDDSALRGAALVTAYRDTIAAFEAARG